MLSLYILGDIVDKIDEKGFNGEEEACTSKAKWEMSWEASRLQQTYPRKQDAKT